MSSLISALRGEIEAIVRREIRLALKGLPSAPASAPASAPVAGKRGPGRPAKAAAGASGSRVEVSAKDLQSLRGKLKVSGPELGRLAGVSTATIYNWEKAKGSVKISADVAATVAKLHTTSAEQAREQLGPAARRGRKPGKAAAAPVAKVKGKPGRKPGKAKAVKAAGSTRVEVSAKDLQSLRGKLKVSGPELGRLAGVSTATIYNWEKAKGSVSLSADVAVTVAKLLGTSAEQARAQLGPAAKRGRKPGQVVAAKKRGRPAKVKPAEAAAPAAAAPKKRGRPAKAKPAEATAPAAAAPKKRGRPAKVKPAEAAAPVAAPKKRGRPAKVKPAEVVAAPVAPKKRGRPAKVKPAEAAAPVAAPKKRGRPAKVKPAETPAPAAS